MSIYMVMRRIIERGKLMAEAKKKRIQIQGRNGNYGVSGGINFSWVSSPATGRKQVGSWYTCRDYISDDLQSFYKQNGMRVPKDGATIDTERFRLLIASALSKDSYDDWKQALYDAKRIINIYEEIAGFDRTSVLTRVDHSAGKKVEYCWLLTGPAEWVRYSQLVSMVTLIFRIVTRYKQASDLETIEQVENYWQQIIKDANKPNSKYNHQDNTGYLPNCWRKWHMMMKWYDRIFTLSGKDAHTPGNNWHSYGGINSLCNFSTNMPKIDGPMKKAWEEWQQKYLKKNG